MTNRQSPLPLISVVTPVYGGAHLAELHDRLTRALTATTDRFEIVMVNDASPDDAWEIIAALAKDDPRVRGVDLAENVGQHIAILAGLDHACGEWIVVMDCDLQDRPEEIPRLYRTAAEGFDIVLARRASQQHPPLRRLSSKIFYQVLKATSGIAGDPLVANFGIYRRPVIEAVRAIRDRHFFPLMVRAVGFRLTGIDVVHGARVGNRSSYDWPKRLKLAYTTIKSNWRGRKASRPASKGSNRGYSVRALCGAACEETKTAAA